MLYLKIKPMVDKNYFLILLTKINLSQTFLTLIEVLQLFCKLTHMKVCSIFQLTAKKKNYAKPHY